MALAFGGMVARSLIGNGRMVGMAYPDPTPELKGKNAVEFERRLKSFKLSEAQKNFYKDAKHLYKKVNENSSK